MEKINVNWEGPFSIDEITDGKIDSNLYEITSDDIGLYQIYGSHPLYGDGVLVYIGRTMNQNGFRSRLNNRWVVQNGTDNKNVKIYLGKIFSDSKIMTSEEIELKIEKAEVLLINAMKPAFNSSNIQSAKTFENEFTVYNHGSHRSIYPILESEYFWGDMKNISIVDKFTKYYDDKIKIESDKEFYGFDLQDNDNICFGVDYAYWNKTDIPLVIGIYKEDVDNKELKLKLAKEFGGISNNEDKNYYFVPACSDLEDKNVLKEIKDNLLKIKEIINA